MKKTLRKRLAIGATIVSLVGGIVGGITSGFFESFRRNPSETIQTVSRVINKEISMEDGATYITSNSGRSDICIQSFRQAAENVFQNENNDINDPIKAFLGYGFNNSSWCNDGLSGLDASNIVSYLNDDNNFINGFPNLPNLTLSFENYNGVNIATYKNSLGLNVGQIIDLSSTSARFISPEEYRRILLGGDFGNIILAGNPMATGEEDTYNFDIRPYHFYIQDGVTGNYIYSEVEKVEDVLNNPEYVFFSFTNDGDYHVGEMTNEIYQNTETAYVSAFNFMSNDEAEITYDGILEQGAVYKTGSNIAICDTPSGDYAFINSGSIYLETNEKTEFTLSAGLQLTNEGGNCVVFDDAQNFLNNTFHGELMDEGTFAIADLPIEELNIISETMYGEPFVNPAETLPYLREGEAPFLIIES